jgi:hypothetical protein
MVRSAHLSGLEIELLRWRAGAFPAGLVNIICIIRLTRSLELYRAPTLATADHTVQ